MTARRPTLHVHSELFPTLHRIETLMGREFLVVPMVLLREMVLRPASGGEFVPFDELELTVEKASWEGRPLMLGHPTGSNGGWESGGAVRHAASTQLGRVQNVIADAFIRGLVGESWFDLLWTPKVEGGQAILDRLEDGGKIENSTSYWTMFDQTPGRHNGVAFQRQHRHLEPDHHAVLGEEIGACSIADGCGVNRVNVSDRVVIAMSRQFLANTKGNRNVSEDVRSFAQANSEPPADDPPAPADPPAPVDPPANADEGFWKRGYQALLRFLGVDNELSHSDIRAALRVEIAQAEDIGEDEHVWVVDSFDNRVIYEMDDTLYERSYELGANDSIILGAERFEVQRRTDYVRVGTGISNRGDGMTLKEMVQKLAANEACPFDEKQLGGFEEAQVKALAEAYDCGCENGGDPDPAPAPAGNAGSETPAPQPAERGLSSEETQALAALVSFHKDGGFETLKGIAESEQRDRKQTIARLAANSECPLPESALERLSAEELERVDAHFSGGLDFTGLAGGSDLEDPDKDSYLRQTANSDGDGLFSFALPSKG